MAYDKYQAIKNHNRISEKTLLMFAFCFGALGLFLAMLKPISHKKNKLKFKVIIPLFLIINIMILYFMIKQL